MKKKIIVITGPTASGKSDFAIKLANSLKIKTGIVNGDLGQFYSKLTIGTAKPDIKAEIIPHYLFDIIDQPKDFTVTEYKKMVLDCFEKLWAENRLPILVGGSGFYLKSLFFTPKDIKIKKNKKIKKINYEDKSNQELWNILNEIDPARAIKLHENDRYRVLRALDIYFSSGMLPSDYEPNFEPFGDAIVLFLTREKIDLHSRIESRLIQMFETGWIEEVENLPEDWKNFLFKKKIIGYDEILEYLNGDLSKKDLFKAILQRTKAYAKTQLTFFRYFSKTLKEADKSGEHIKDLKEISLTLLDLDLYINQLSKDILKIFNLRED